MQYKINMSKEQLKTFRKGHYRRGFKACLVLLVCPLCIAFVLYSHYIIKLLNY